MAVIGLLRLEDASSYRHTQKKNNTKKLTTAFVIALLMRLLERLLVFCTTLLGKNAVLQYDNYLLYYSTGRLWYQLCLLLFTPIFCVYA